MLRTCEVLDVDVRSECYEGTHRAFLLGSVYQSDRRAIAVPEQYRVFNSEMLQKGGQVLARLLMQIVDFT